MKDDPGTVQRPPAKVDRLLLPESILRDTITGLRLGGAREMLCYWLGTELTHAKGISAIVCTVAFPKVKSSYGHFELVEGQMGLITEWCADAELWLLAQVHTHPTDEGHSTTDETCAASLRAGFLSVVFPFFAEFSSVRDPHWRLYESLGEGLWEQVDPGARLQIVPSMWLPPR